MEITKSYLKDLGYRVNGAATDGINPVYETQLMTYMKLLNSPEGLLLNFNTTNIYKEGQRTYVNELYRNLPN